MFSLTTRRMLSRAQPQVHLFSRPLLFTATSHLVGKVQYNKPFVAAAYSTAPPPHTPQPQSTQTPATTPPPDSHSTSKLSKENLKVQSGKLRTFIRKYGPIGIVTYFGMYGVTLAGIYGLVSSGLVMANDAISLFKAVHLDKLIDLEAIDPRTGNFAVAWILTKFTEPIRFALTIAITPSLYRFITGRRSAISEDDDDHDHDHDEHHDKKDKKKKEKDDDWYEYNTNITQITTSTQTQTTTHNTPHTTTSQTLQSDTAHRTTPYLHLDSRIYPLCF